QEGSDESKLKKLDELLINFLQARRNIFSVIVKQLSLSYFIEGLILSAFFILGGYLVFEGKMPIGEFVAIEIIIISVLNALRDFMKQIDYIYDTIEGFYKIEKLAHSLKESHTDV
ncbi:MAG: ABC transporter ATP-binding protein, partial [Sulfurimonas sp.]|nr:ABC transporter ATP-binding protein [Sulfurimonas sp.]